tara:strand:- start:213 stop:1724 length:1512 start_codon:yes stop_codon:yes gene_type:complete
MLVYFRTDLSLKIGTGHAIRCLALSKSLQKKGIETRFIFRDYLDGTRPQIEKLFRKPLFIESEAKEKRGIINNEYRWNNKTLKQDAIATRRLLQNKDIDWLIVDHYSINREWEKVVKKEVKNILVIDDLGDRDHLCDVLLDSNSNPLAHSIYKKRVNKSTDLLLGNKYALLDPNFSKARSNLRKKNFKKPNILIFFGGIDLNEYTLQAVEAVNMLDMNISSVDVVVGGSYANKKALRLLCKKYEFRLHIQTKKMHELMANADISIGSGGSATWERCCVGLPSIVFAAAENQKDIIYHASRKGLIFSPSNKESFNFFIRKHLISFITNEPLLEFMSNNCLEAIDGQGSNRVANLLIGKTLQVRNVDLKDTKNIFNWRNDPLIRNVSRKKNIIKFSDHMAWMNKIISSDQNAFLIVEKNKEAVGVVRYDMSELNIAEVSIYLVPKEIGKGLGKSVLLKADEWFKSHYPDIKIINANVLSSNSKSIHLFESANYKLNNCWLSKKNS